MIEYRRNFVTELIIIMITIITARLWFNPYNTYNVILNESNKKVK